MKFIIVSTFVVGFLTGMFVFVMSGGLEGESPQVEPGEIQIIGRETGGCEEMSTCASYRILESGAYVYLKGNGDGEDKFEGTLSNDSRDALFDLLETDELQDVLESDSDYCPDDEISYHYSIRDSQTEYQFDSCVHDLFGSDFFQLLIDYFEIFRVTYYDETM